MSDPRPEASLLVVHAAEACTLQGPPGPRAGPWQRRLGIITDGAVAVSPEGRIVAVGPTTQVQQAVRLTADARTVDASGRALLPGFVDPHTHAIFGGDRADEFEQRLAGADYLAILAAGGGILSTVRATRAASDADLYRRAGRFLDEMLRHGVTTVEVKSGYGLSLEDEVRLLRVARSLGTGPQQVVATLLAAHAVPPEYRADPERYVNLVCDEIVPAVSAEGLADACDVFCERGAFDIDQSRRVLEAGLAHGLRPKVHAEQKSRLGGARLAASLGALSADHLEHAEADDLAALAAARTVAVLLPSAALVLRETRWAEARHMVEAGVPVALATDFNPGTSPVLSMPLVIGLACLRLGLTPAEAIMAATLNAAYAVGLGEETGSLEVGKRADLLILDAPSHRHVPYWLGRNLAWTVIANGMVVVDEGRLDTPRAGT